MQNGLVWPADTVSRWKIADITPAARNPRTHSAEQVAQIAAAMREWGWTIPVLVDEQGTLIAGHGRLLAAQRLGYDEAPVMVAHGWTDAQKRAYVIADNKLALNAGWDADLLGIDLAELSADGYALELLGFDAAELKEWMPDADADASGAAGDVPKGNLAERFMVSPFSVLNAREGWWQGRKRAWIALGIRSELGRDDAMIFQGDAQQRLRDMQRQGKTPAPESDAPEQTGTSVFDPVLCEIAYRWFSPPTGTVLDPFAGGSVRGIVAGKLGRQYVGMDLRAEQVDANRVQAAGVIGPNDPMPCWHAGDSRTIDRVCADVDADLVFTCPPYADLEVYSDDPADLSTLGYAEFRAAYAAIIAKACSRLKADRFAVCVVGEVRGKDGGYYDFVGDTVQAFRDAGLTYYNEAILLTAIGSLPIRAGRQFAISRKLGKTHQNVLVFVKGDAKRAAQACGVVEVDEALLGTPDEGAD